MPAFATNDSLDWTVEKRPLTFPGNDGTPVVWDNQMVMVRTDNGRPLGPISSGYEPVQNSVLKQKIDPMVSEGVLTIENMGYLSHGAKVFIQAKLAKDFVVVDEKHEAYLTLLNCHTGKASVAMGTAAVRVICGNTFAMAYSGISERYRHTEGVNELVMESTAVVDFVNECMGAYAARVEKLALAPCSVDKFQDVLEQVYQKDIANMRNVELMVDLFKGGTGGGNNGSNLADAFNAITDFGSNFSRKAEASRFNYVNFGTGVSINRRAMDVLTEMAAV